VVVQRGLSTAPAEAARASQSQTKTRATDDIVDLPYLTQSCLGQAWNRALLLILVTCCLPRVRVPRMIPMST
jgi:hypothetical protein